MPPSKLTDTLRQALRRQEKVSTVKYLTAEVVQSLDFLDKLNKEDKKEDVSLKPGIAVKIPVVYLPGTRLATQVLIYVLANKAKSTS